MIRLRRIDVGGAQVDAGRRQLRGEKASRRFDGPVADGEETVAGLDRRARRGSARFPTVRSNEKTGRLGDSSLGAVQRRDPHVKSLGELHDLARDAETN